MTAIKTLAAELLLTMVSVAYHCRRNGIETVRRLPENAVGGQMCAHVRDEDAAAIRQHYRDRVRSREG